MKPAVKGTKHAVENKTRCQKLSERLKTKPGVKKQAIENETSCQ